VEPLENVLNVDGNITISSPASSALVTHIVGVNIGESCPTLRKDIDLVQHALEHEDENNVPFTPGLTKKQHKDLNRSAYNTHSKGDHPTTS
jgi:hypothetical protein